jgi:hypothetical protein
MLRSIPLVLIVACGSVLPATYSADDLPDPASLSEEWGCGTGFWASDPGETVALRLAYQGEGQPDAEVQLPHADWEAVFVEGSDLYANWCDDVIESDEPTPVEHWELPVVAGTLVLIGEPPEPFTGGELSVRASDLVVELPDGSEAPLGSFEITNPMWGFFAG